MKTLDVWRKDQVGYVYLNRTSHFNVFNETMFKELTQLFNAWHHDLTLRAIVLEPVQNLFSINCH